MSIIFSGKMSMAGTILAQGNTPTVALSNTFNVAGANTWTVPSSVTSATIMLWGGGGGSGGQGYMNGGGGGGGGSFAAKVLSVTPGQIISFTVGAGGAAGGYNGFGQTTGSTGGNSIYSTVTAGGGYGGGDGIGGSGGAASGGDVNISGSTGLYQYSPPYSTNGGLAANSTSAAANSGTTPFSGIQPGGGQGGGGNDFTGTGGVGRVRFEYETSSGASPLSWTGGDAANDGFWYNFASNTLELGFYGANGGIAFITSGSTRGDGPTGWTPYTPASSFELSIKPTYIDGDPGTVSIGNYGVSYTSIANNTQSAYFNLGSTVAVKASGTTFAITDFTVTIREVANTANFISKTFTIDTNTF